MGVIGVTGCEPPTALRLKAPGLGPTIDTNLSPKEGAPDLPTGKWGAKKDGEFAP